MKSVKVKPCYFFFFQFGLLFYSQLQYCEYNIHKCLALVELMWIYSPRTTSSVSILLLSRLVERTGFVQLPLSPENKKKIHINLPMEEFSEQRSYTKYSEYTVEVENKYIVKSEFPYYVSLFDVHYLVARMIFFHQQFYSIFKYGASVGLYFTRVC